MPVSGPEAPSPAADERVRVWDVVVRLCHWGLATLVVLNLVRDDGDEWHRLAGYVAVGVVALRVLHHGPGGWRTLKPSLRDTLAYLRGGAPRTLQHDPLGLWMVWLLWLLVLLLGLTGWMSRLDAFWGDERVRALHAWLANTLMVSVAVHLAGVAAMSWRWRENLPAAMLSGRKRPRTEERPVRRRDGGA